MTELFALMNVREMHLDDGHIDRRDCVADRNAVMRECGSVEDDVVRRAACRLNRVHKHALVV